MPNCVYVKIGMLLLDITVDKVLCNELDELWNLNELDYYKKINSLYSEMPSLLSRCKNISNIRWIGDLREEHDEPFNFYDLEESPIFLQQASTYLAFDVNIPKEERQFCLEVRYHDVAEQCSVLYNGKFFVVYAVNEANSTYLLGQEVRELLVKTLECKHWKPYVIPPCPLHIDIILEEPGFDSEVLYKDDMVIPLNGEDLDELELYLDFIMSDITFFVETFMSYATLNNKISRLARVIDQAIGNLTTKMKELITMEWYDLAGKWIKMREITQLSCDFQEKANEYTTDVLTIKMGLKELEQFIPISDYNRTLFKYATDRFEEPPLLIEDRRETVKFIMSLIASSYTSYSTLLAGLLGAVIGAALTIIGASK